MVAPHNDISGQVTGPVVQSGHIDAVYLHPVPPSAMAGLPAEDVFCGREPELAVLADVLAPRGVGPVATAVVAGLPGVGKTALAVRAAHRALAAGWFTGGALFVDMHGYDPTRRVDADTALGALLRALGVLGSHIPAGQDEREALYRSELVDLAKREQRVLVVVDNAADVEQVLPLRPAGAVHRLLVTSRHTLPLPASRRVELDVLPSGEAASVIEDALRAADPGDDRVGADHETAVALAELCGRLPLALRITAELLADLPQESLGELVEIFSDARSRLGELAYGDSVAVRVAFDASYRRLPADQARLFRLLSLHPGPHLDREAAGMLAATTPDDTRHLLDGLRRAHLVATMTGKGRYRFHDLIRLYATEACEREESAADRAAAVERLVDGYRVAMVAAASHLEPTVPADRLSTRFAGREAALAWLDVERPNLVAVTLLAADTAAATGAYTGDDRHLLDLTAALFPYFSLRKYWPEAVLVCARALEAARGLGDRQAEVDTLSRLGTAHRGMRRSAEAIAYHEQALAICRDVGDRRGEGGVRNSLGTAYRDLGRFEEALESFGLALALCQECGDLFGEAVSLNNLGGVHRGLSRFAEAVDLYRRALVLRRQTGDLFGEAISLNNLGSAYHSMRRLDDAQAHFRQALEIRRRTGDRFGESVSLNCLANVLRDLRRYGEAVVCLRAGLAIRQETGDAYQVAIALTSLGDTYRDSGDVEEAADHYLLAADGFEQAGATESAQRNRALAAALPTTALPATAPPTG
jgi:tetratricopeptide (TPR) repeat protein